MLLLCVFYVLCLLCTVCTVCIVYAVCTVCTVCFIGNILSLTVFIEANVISDLRSI